jgi:hypothetical protein
MKRLELYLELVNFNNIVLRTCLFHIIFLIFAQKRVHQEELQQHT